MIATQTRTESIAHLGETKLIEQIRSWLGPVSPPPPKGIGDDCAVSIPLKGKKQLITTDAVNYGYHFDNSMAPSDAGAKLIKRNISDIAAMGGTPHSAVLALLCSPNISIKWMEGFFRGIRDACKYYSISLIGGDISTLEATAFSAVLTLNGHVEKPKLRSSGKIGDHIYVTGTLGGSILGKHYQFEPRLAEGQWLSKRSQCHAMIDLSDGLGKDLKTLLPENTAAHLFTDQIPVSEAAKKLAQTSGLSELEHAFCDGEDYELLFTLDTSEDLEHFEKSWHRSFPKTRLSCIGTIQPSIGEKEPYLNAQTREPLPWRHGFEHLIT